MGATESRLAEFVVQQRTEDIPAEVMHLATRCLMNYLSVALFAARDPSINILLDVFRVEGGNEVATVIGSGFRTSLQQAALANGYLGHFEDYDDTHVLTVIHPSSPIFPACLAVGEATGASGREVLAAYAIGVDVACRIGRVIAPRFRPGAEFWHITNTCGGVGAVAGAGRLLGLDVDQMVHALGIAATQGSGLREVFGSMCKPFHAGKAAMNGVLAGMLAQRGFTSTDSSIAGARGLMAVMAQEYDPDEVTRDLGTRWELPENGLKPYACGLANHGFVDAMLALRTRDGVRPDSIQHISGSVRSLAPALVKRRHPRTGLEGKFCYPHAMAVALVDGCAYPAQFTDERVVDPVLHALRERIDVTADPSLPRRTATITATLTDGRTYTERVDFSVGTPENPMSDAQVEEKLRALAGDVLPASQVDELVQQLWQVVEVPSIGQVMANTVAPVLTSRGELQHA